MSNRPAPLVLAALGTAAASLAWLAAMLLGADLPAWVGWAPSAASALLASAACWQTGSLVGSRRGRQFWRQAAVALGVAGAASVLLLVQNLAEVSTRPGPLVRGMYVTAVLASLVALVRLPRRRGVSRAERMRIIPEAMLIFASAVAVAWQLSLGDTGDWAGGGGWVAVGTILAMGVVATAAFITIALGDGAVVDQRALRALALGIAVGAILAASAPIMLTQGLRPIVAILPFVTVGYAAAAHRQRFGGVGAGRPRGVTAYLPFLATSVLLLLIAHRSGHGGLPLTITIVLLMAVAGHRQWSSSRSEAELRRRVESGVRDLRSARTQLAHQEGHDDLTGLANRQLFERRLDDIIDSGGDVGVVALIDIDDFKAVNDRLHHAVGDELLMVLAQRIVAAIRPGDVVARLGSDAFAVLLRDLSPDRALSAVSRVAERISQPARVTEHEVFVSVSVGVALGLGAGADAAELLRRSDVAMHTAKSSGKARIVVYEAEMDRRATHDAKLGADLRRALDRDEFFLVYQPVVRLPDGCPAGAEALVRWRHPERGVVPPVEFIPLAEQTGLIVPLGLWVLNEACRQAAQWLRDLRTTGPWKVSVNVSARQLSEPGFAVQVAEALAGWLLPADRLMIEVTETAIFDNETATATLRQISALGVALALDDFGTGHSSLSLLRTAPVDVLKVDKSFVDDLGGDNAESTIVTATLYIANGLRLSAVAEGVETPTQARRLYELGYQLAQGYHFAKPLPAEEMAALLAGAAPLPPPRRAAPAPDPLTTRSSPPPAW
ncbi:putative bifunctional diguanylate cyclase/phosphodiesterase [Pilimelia columellifera]|uniref:Bifunctional diguanylate cyclase/phosphodiesterase n=1 Tax=Pilimelia columellifera subsp. columellifera TaxID=706583 RepID=A0ABP6ATT2_9ACTN